MRPHEFAELSAFIAIAEEGSFRRAAARLNLTSSTLSHSLRALEQRLDVRLLQRTTRSVSLTDAGTALLAQIAPAFSSIATAIDGVNAFRERPRGTVRLNLPLLAAQMVLAPRLGQFHAAYPDIVLEVAINDGLVDIVREGYDAGMRLGDSVELDMATVPVSGAQRLAIVGAPAYFAQHAAPHTPHDLQAHNCIGYRLVAGGTLCRWQFARDGHALEIQVSGPMVLGTPGLMLDAALAGVGLASALENTVTAHLAAGRLVRVLDDWCPPFAGFHLYYPSRRQMPAALRALIDFLRFDEAALPGNESQNISI